MVFPRSRRAVSLLFQSKDAAGMKDFGIEKSPGFRHKEEFENM
jgi:hypothetical protein